MKARLLGILGVLTILLGAMSSFVPTAQAAGEPAQTMTIFTSHWPYHPIERDPITIQAQVMEIGVTRIDLYIVDTVTGARTQHMCKNRNYCALSIMLSVGTYEYFATATDTLGHKDHSGTTYFYVEAAKPQVSISHSPQEPAEGETTVITVTASDPDGIREIRVYVDGALRTICNTTTICTLSIADLIIGSHFYYAEVTGRIYKVASPIVSFTVKNPEGMDVISGMMWDLRTGQPLAGVSYTLYGYYDRGGQDIHEIIRYGSTGMNGSLREKNLPAGRYFLNIRTNDYANFVRIDHSGGAESVWTCDCPDGMFEMQVGPIELNGDEKPNIWLALYDHPWEPGVVLPPKGLG